MRAASTMTSALVANFQVELSDDFQARNVESAKRKMCFHPPAAGITVAIRCERCPQFYRCIFICPVVENSGNREAVNTENVYRELR